MFVVLYYSIFLISGLKWNKFTLLTPYEYKYFKLELFEAIGAELISTVV